MNNRPALREKFRATLIGGLVLLCFTAAAVLFKLAIGAITCGAGMIALLFLAYGTWVRICDVEYKIREIKKLLVDQGEIEQADVIERVMRKQYGV